MYPLFVSKPGLSRSGDPPAMTTSGFVRWMISSAMPSPLYPLSPV